jgi:YspA, cpYpsA-related SLOG family
MKLLVCGGRHYADRDAVFSALDRAHAKREITLLIHGAARGADTLGEEWAKSRQIPYLGHPARWTQYDKAAGGLRNQAMLNRWAPDGVVAFPGGTGTADMKRRAEFHGITVWEPQA